MRTLVFAVVLSLLWAPLAMAQDRTASERYANALRKASGLSPSAIRLVDDALDKGWPEGGAAETLNALLRANAPALVEMRRGAALSECVLYPGHNVFDRSMDDISLLERLARLCGAQALRALHQGDELQVARDVAALLGVGRQLAADRMMAIRKRGLGLVRLGCAIGGRLSESGRKVLAEKLIRYVLPTAVDVAAAEKAVFIDAVDFTSREVPFLRPNMLTLAPGIGAIYYDPLVFAFASGVPANGASADDEVRALAPKLQQMYGQLTPKHIAEVGRMQQLSADEQAADLCRAILVSVWPKMGDIMRDLEETRATVDGLRRPGRE